MNEKRLRQIGIDRLVRLAWLEQAAAYAVAGEAPTTAKDTLQEMLRPSFRTGQDTVRGSLDKTLTILMKIWFNPPVELAAFRDTGLRLLPTIASETHIAVHWGMVMAAYPFWGNVATHTGRLLRLQDSVTIAQVQRRIREQYGERELVSRRVRYVLQSYVDWGVLLGGTKASGSYTPQPTIPIDKPELAAWLLEAALHSRDGGAAPLDELVNTPALFPFKLTAFPPAAISQHSPRLDVVQHGMDNILIRLR